MVEQIAVDGSYPSLNKIIVMGPFKLRLTIS